MVSGYRKSGYRKIKEGRKKKTLEDIITLPDREKIDFLAKTLSKQIDSEVFRRKTAPAKEVLKVIGAGIFIAASFAVPTLPMALRPFLKNENEYEVWKRFNIPFLKRTLTRLEKQKLIEIVEKDNLQEIRITDRGRKRILRYSLEELAIRKPKFWDGYWRLVSYDLPEKLGRVRNILREYLNAWGFYPFHESVFLHAYPCEKEVEFIREYLGIGNYVRILLVRKIENDLPFREFFGV